MIDGGRVKEIEIKAIEIDWAWINAEAIEVGVIVRFRSRVLADKFFVVLVGNE